MKIYDIGNGYFGINVGGKVKRLHRYIWEFYNGLIPKGMVIHHINENKACNCIPNLQLMTLSEHVRHHAEGRTWSDEIKQKMSETHKLMSAETKQKMSAARKGRIVSAETRQKISASSKGKVRVFSEEHCQRLSIASKVYWTNKKQKENN